jgi:carboxyl-terminal processing protease
MGLHEPPERKVCMRNWFFKAVFWSCLIVIFTGKADALENRTPYVLLFEEICRIVEENYYSPALVRDKFPLLKATCRDLIETTADQTQFSKHVNSMLAGLNSSHTYYLSPKDYEYYQLAAVFEKIPVVQKVFQGKGVVYPTVGILTETIEGKVFIVSVLPGSIAEQSGLFAGDEIVAANGKPYTPIGSLESNVGGMVVFSIKRSPAEKVQTISMVPEYVNPKTEMLDAEKASIRIIEAEGVTIGYIHIYSYAGREYHDELVSAISWGALKDADALIIDLRYGLGGADPGYLNIFNPKVPVITTTDRAGKTDCYDPQWRRPTVFLVNKTTRSGKEILAFGARKYNLATVIGERTAGAVSAGQLFPLSNSDFLYLAVRSSLIDGVKLEGVGVSPDIEAPMEIRYCKGKDFQLDLAVKYLNNRGK